MSVRIMVTADDLITIIIKLMTEFSFSKDNVYII